MQNNPVKIKICGLTRQQDIEAVNAARPDYIGFVFAPSRRQVTLAQACELRAGLHKDIVPIGVFVDASIDMIVSAVNAGAIDAVQLHGAEDEAFIAALRVGLQNAMAELMHNRAKTVWRDNAMQHSNALYPCASVHIPVIKAVSVSKKGDAAAWENSTADFLLLDHKGGGTGEAFDWSLIGNVKKPFFLAGGLSPQNAAAACAIKTDADVSTDIPLVADISPISSAIIRPYALDVSSGIESTPGVKCPKKIMEFVCNVRQA